MCDKTIIKYPITPKTITTTAAMTTTMTDTSFSGHGGRANNVRVPINSIEAPKADIRFTNNPKIRKTPIYGTG